MIVDTSALIAVAYREFGADTLETALLTLDGLLPAPAFVEFERVIFKLETVSRASARVILNEALDRGVSLVSFTAEDARLAVAANDRYGSRTSRDGKLNLLDLMVYGMAKRTGMPILCTGNDFRMTDALIHPASRIG